jgi:hypothetical protein
MTTDLTGDFELGEEELDWDVFLPDPDEAEIAAEAAALEDEADLDLDDSDIDWEAALNEHAEPENGARAGAAYDRIVDTVRRSFEEPEAEAPAQANADADASVETETETESELVAVAAPETPHALLPEPAEDETAPGAEAVADAQYEDAVDGLVEFSPADDQEPGESAFMAVPDPAAEPMADMDPEETDAAPLWSAALFAPDPDLEPGSDGASEPELERFTSPAEPATTAVAAAMWTVDPEPNMPSEPEATWTARLPFEDPEDAVEAEPALEFLSADEASGGEEEADGKTPRSRVFTATLVLACLFLVVVAAAVAVRALHHPTTAAPPPAHTAPPSHRTAPVAPSPSAARIQTATDAVDSATTAASVGLTSLSAFPTPTNVETVINPYISSLQLYEAVLSGTKMPVAARPAAASAVAQLRQDLKFLDTIDGLPPDQLGAYMVQFDTDATRLQTTLSTLEQNLRTTTP